jgi:hypothetical protein
MTPIKEQVEDSLRMLQRTELSKGTQTTTDDQQTRPSARKGSKTMTKWYDLDRYQDFSDPIMVAGALLIIGVIARYSIDVAVALFGVCLIILSHNLGKI